MNQVKAVQARTDQTQGAPPKNELLRLIWYGIARIHVIRTVRIAGRPNLSHSVSHHVLRQTASPIGEPTEERKEKFFLWKKIQLTTKE
jgi:hypothetical protein